MSKITGTQAISYLSKELSKYIERIEIVITYSENALYKGLPFYQEIFYFPLPHSKKVIKALIESKEFKKNINALLSDDGYEDQPIYNFFLLFDCLGQRLSVRENELFIRSGQLMMKYGFFEIFENRIETSTLIIDHVTQRLSSNHYDSKTQISTVSDEDAIAYLAGENYKKLNEAISMLGSNKSETSTEITGSQSQDPDSSREAIGSESLSSDQGGTDL